MLTAHDVLTFRRRQASMTVFDVEPWRRSADGRLVWSLALEDDSGTWLLMSRSDGVVRLHRHGSSGATDITEDL